MNELNVPHCDYTSIVHNNNGINPYSFQLGFIPDNHESHDSNEQVKEISFPACM